MRFVTQVATFVGPLSFVFDDDALGVDAAGNVCNGAVTRSQFVPLSRFRAGGATRVAADRATGDLGRIVEAVRRWSDGDADALAPVPVLQAGSEFRQRVWQALRSVPGGDVITYQQLAKLAGKPNAVRAVGTTMAINAVAPFVPCHRVVRQGGEIGNYAYGSEMKVSMLQREGLIVD